MPKNIVEERLRWVQMVENSDVSLKDVIEIFPYSELEKKELEEMQLRDYPVQD